MPRPLSTQTKWYDGITFLEARFFKDKSCQELPFFRRSWTVQLFAGTQTQASQEGPFGLGRIWIQGRGFETSGFCGELSQETQASSFGALASLPGFVVGSLSVSQWRWRGWLAELALTCQNPAQGARSQARA